uniref:NADH dehydrogenase subunit 2 n=1 Tax=Sargus mactans TaxID=3018258 RepID=UPI0022FD931F|nr:NADH dehydrogenase subunit 2 [Sargus mactans]WBF90453.1 NADH dehydrogenase subunit 2 [Sargus mactans]
MFNNSTKILFLTTLISSTLIAVSSSSWLSAWMGLEINLLSFIPLMNSNKNLMSTETALKYFLTQAIASSIFLVAVILSMLKSSLFPQTIINYNSLIIIALMIKSGTAPFHFWFPSVMDGLSWINSIILMTWQKIAPMILMSYIFSFNFMYFFIITSSLVGAIGGLNQSSIRKLMAFSSINHIGWMLAAMAESNKLWLTYFLFYAFLSTTVILIFNYYKIFHLNQMYSLFNSSSILKFTLCLNLLSMGGLPPFLGFFPKWIVIQQLTSINQMMLIFVLLLTSLVTLFFYLRLCYPAFLIGNTEHNWMSIEQFNSSFNFMTICSFISIVGLPTISALYFML